MATTKTTMITNLDASPLVKQAVGVLSGRVRAAVATVSPALVDIDAVGDIVLMVRLPTNARVLSIKKYGDALTGLVADLGLYNTDGTVKDADAYASALNIASADKTGTEAAYEARDINKAGQRVWEDAGDASDPGGHYDIGWTVTTVASATGDMTLVVLYTLD